MIAIIVLGLFLLLVIVGVPMAIALMTASVAGCLYIQTPMISLGQAAFESLFSYTTSAIPFYIFAGVLMTRGGISKRLVDLAQVFVKRITGGLGMVSVLACTFFAAISGSSTATTAAIGSMMVPQMEEHGYDKNYALAIVASGGVVGPIIPPSIAFVLYGVSTSTSVSDLFLGGIIPGIIMSIAMLLVVYATSKVKGYTGIQGEKNTIADVGRAIWNAKWAILVPVIILGGIYGGIFTPTEAGAVACVYALLVSLFVEKSLKPIQIFDVLAEAAISSCVILMLVASATMFGKVLTLGQIPQIMTSYIMSISSSALIAMILINVLLFVVGCVMDATPAILILSPLLLPIAKAFGFSALHFGVIMVVNLCIGSITPPVGCCLFAASIVGNTKIEKIVRPVLPFLISLVISLIVIILVPELSTWLPSLFN